MVSKAEALKGVVEIPLISTRAARQSAKKGVANFRGVFWAWLQRTQFGADRSRELGRHLGARC
jgi:hypothetical protein